MKRKRQVMLFVLMTVLMMTAVIWHPVKAQAAKGKFRTATGWAGDVDGNQSVDENDLEKLIKYLNGWQGYSAEEVFADADENGGYSEADRMIADLNGDGKVDAIDAVILTRVENNWQGYYSRYIIWKPELTAYISNASTPAKIDSKTGKVRLDLIINNGKEPYEVNWYRDGYAISGATGRFYEAIQAGSYYAIVKDASGASRQTAPRTVELPPLTIRADKESITDVLPKTIYVYAEGGIEDYTYEWFLNNISQGKTSEAYMNVWEEGTWRCVVTDATWKTAECTVPVVNTGFHIVVDYPTQIEIPNKEKGADSENVTIPLHFKWINGAPKKDDFSVSVEYRFPSETGYKAWTSLGEFPVYTGSSEYEFASKPTITRGLLRQLGATQTGLYVRFEVRCKGRIERTKEIYITDSNVLRFVMFSSEEDTVGHFVESNSRYNYSFVLKARAAGGTDSAYWYFWRVSDTPDMKNAEIIANSGTTVNAYNKTFMYDVVKEEDNSALNSKYNGKYVQCFAFDMGSGPNTGLSSTPVYSEVRRVYTKLEGLHEFVYNRNSELSARTFDFSASGYGSDNVQLFFDYTLGVPFKSGAAYKVRWFVNDEDVTDYWHSASGNDITYSMFSGGYRRSKFPVCAADLSTQTTEVYCVVEDAIGQKITSNKFTLKKR